MRAPFENSMGSLYTMADPATGAISEHSAVLQTYELSDDSGVMLISPPADDGERMMVSLPHIPVLSGLYPGRWQEVSDNGGTNYEGAVTFAHDKDSGQLYGYWSTVDAETHNIDATGVWLLTPRIGGVALNG